MKSIHGLGTALVTPFKNGMVDFDQLAELLEYQIEGGIDYIVTMGTTGESATLSMDEISQIVRFTVDKIGGRVPLVVGLGGNNTAHVARQIKDFDFTGVEAILSASPAYNKPSQAGIVEHYKVLCEASPRPIIVYNVPGRTASNITASTTITLSRISGICGIKEASGDLQQAAEIIKGTANDFAVISGDDPTAYHMRALGGNGCISVISNLLPSLFKVVPTFSSFEEMNTALETHDRLLNIHHWLYIDGNPVGIKAALHAKGLCSEDVRLPLVGMQPDNKKRLIQEMEMAGI